MAEKKISTTVYLTETQLGLLKALNQKTRVPIAEYIRMGIDIILEQHSDHLPGQTSLFEGLSPDQLGKGRRRLASGESSPEGGEQSADVDESASPPKNSS